MTLLELAESFPGLVRVAAMKLRLFCVVRGAQVSIVDNPNHSFEVNSIPQGCINFIQMRRLCIQCTQY